MTTALRSKGEIAGEHHFKIDAKVASSLATKIVNDCLGIKPGENVTIETWTHGLQIAKELFFQVKKVGAQPLLLLEDEETFWKCASKLPANKLGKVGKHEWAVLANSDVFIFFPGPEDRERLRNLPSKVSRAVFRYNDEWYRRAQKSRIRGLRIGLSYVTRDRAKILGVDYDEWIRQELAALDTDYQRIDKTGQRIASLLGKAKKLSVTHPNGTNLQLTLAHMTGRYPLVDTGVMKEQYDPATSHKYGVLTNLPAGGVACVPKEDSARGTIKFNLPTPGVKNLTWDVSLTFGSGGELRKYSGGKNFDENFRKPYEKENKPDKGKAAIISIGVNPKQKTGYGFDDSSEGVFLLGIGHCGYGDINKTRFNFYGLLEGSTISADGQTIARKGKVLV